MKLKSLALLCAASLAVSAAHGAVTLTTAAPVGTTVKFLPNVVSVNTPLSVDWGNGVEVKYTVDPSQAAWQRWIEGSIEGTTITINGQLTELTFQEVQLTSATISGMPNLKELDLSKNEITDFILEDVTPLTRLNLGYNKIENSPSYLPQLTLEKCGATLTQLTLAHNEGLQCIDIRSLEKLEYLTMNDCPDLASVFICMPEAAQTTLKNINLSNCDLSHFYPVSLPQLTSLDLANNHLMGDGDYDNFVLGNYPNLQYFVISDNPQLKVLDVTPCTKLEKLLAANCGLQTIDVAQAPDLITLNLSGNAIGNLDLGNNTAITGLYLAGNPISVLDVDKLRSIQYLDISGTLIPDVNIMAAYYLKEFVAANSRLRFVDFNGQQPGRLQLVDLRNSPGFTYESMAYTLKTLPQSKRVWSTNLFVEGSHAEHADTDYLTDADMQWKCDVVGDGTAQWNNLDVTLLDATDTGENKTGVVDRLYPFMGYSMPYDLDVMETDGGRFILAQWQKPWFQTVASVHDKAMNGVPIYCYVYPEEGKRFKSLTINGVEQTSQWFILSENSTVKVNFAAEEPSISLTVPQGQVMSFLLNTATNNGTVWVDWGTGNRTPYPGQRAYASGYAEVKGERIDGTAASTTVTIYGDVSALDASGFGDVAEWFGLWDNHIEAVDLTNAPDLKFLSLYWNPITSIDLSTLPSLEVLNLSYTALTSLDLSANPDIMWLEAYSDGGNSEGIDQLSSIDLTGMPYLQVLDLKGNALTSIDLSENPRLRWADLNGNDLTDIDLSNNAELIELNVSRNNLTDIDLVGLESLTDLNVDSNELTGLDVTKAPSLELLSVANNNIHALDLSSLEHLGRLYINGNGMTAPELNDLYYLLPVRDDSRDDEDQYQTSWNLAVIQGGDRADNEGNRADSSIAVFRGWTPSHTGSNGGSTTAYLDILEAYNGEITVVDAAGNEYRSGSKVEKYLPLTIIANPVDGYKLQVFILNGEEREGTAFDMPGIYSRLTPVFAVNNGLDAAEADATTAIYAAHGQIIVKGNGINATVATLDGRTVATANGINGARAINVAAGVYVVTAGDVTAKLLVK